MENKLKELRKELGYTQKQVADMLGLKCEDRISHWETGAAIPNLLNLSKLCKLYNVSPVTVYPEHFNLSEI